MPIDIPLVAELLVLLSVANSTPVVIKRLMGARAAWPIDGNLLFFDKRPLLGASKTIRGLVAALVFTTLAAPLMGLPLSFGALVGAGSMAGDLLSSFTKRRLAYAPSSRALGLDQIPEALLGALAVQFVRPVRPAEILIVVTLFLVGQLVASRISYALRLRDEPY